jgi:hypothetical protein
MTREEGKGTVKHADPKLRYEQAVSELEGPGAPSHGQRQSQTVDEEGVIEEWVSESSSPHNQCGSR